MRCTVKEDDEMKALRKISSVLNSLLGYITFAAFFVIMAFIVINVIMRFVFDSPVLGAYEIVEQMMFVGVFASFAYAQQQGSHIRVSMILMKMPRKGAMFLCGVTSLLGTFALCVLTYAAVLQYKLAFKNHYTSALLKFPLSPFYVFEIICSIIFAFAVFVDAIQYFAALGNNDLAEELAAKF